MIEAVWQVRRNYLLGQHAAWPLNLVASITNRCNSKCLTCNIWNSPPQAELSSGEYEAVFKNFGSKVLYFTISGGEPFLREDVDQIVISAYNNLRPKMITVATNGLLSLEIKEKVAAISRGCPCAKIMVNLSADEIGPEHDHIRGVKGAYGKLMDTFEQLSQIKEHNLIVAFHTVVSNYNIDRMMDICRELNRKSPYFIMEIAQQRGEFNNAGWAIAPDAEKYAQFIGEYLKWQKTKPLLQKLNLRQLLRNRYYKLSVKILKEKRQVIPCYAGFGSAHIAANGDLWLCSTQAKSVGNLRENNYDFSRVWNSKQAQEERQHAASGACFCPMANVSYLNMLCSFLPARAFFIKTRTLPDPRRETDA